MNFTLNTNTYGLYAHARTSQINDRLGESLEKLSSGLRINSAADDASGMAIANNLRMQSSSLGQSIKNANEAIGVAQIADNAMDEMTNILNTVKTKSIQAAQDGQTTDTRGAIQKDISKLMESYSAIVESTEYNGQSLLNGAFVNKSFQVGAFSNQTVKLNINDTGASSIGHTRFESMSMGGVNAEVDTGASSMTFVNRGENDTDFTIKNITIGTGEGEGVGALAAEINKYSNITGIKANFSNVVQGTGAVADQAAAANITINGVDLGNVAFKANDVDGSLVAAINSKTADHSVTASITKGGELSLRTIDGRAMEFSGLANAGIADTGANKAHVGTLNLVAKDGNDIVTTGTTGPFGDVGVGVAEATLNLAQLTNGFDIAEAASAGHNAVTTGQDVSNGVGNGVSSSMGATMVMDIVENAMKGLDAARSDIGSVTNQLSSQINNITVTQANIKIAESSIRDVDFAAESAEFNKNKLLAQAGTFALSQASSIEQNVMKLLQ